MIFSYQGGNVSARTQQYRYDNAGALFDLTTDPGQAKNIAAERPAVAARFATAVADWRQEVLGRAAPVAATANAKGKGKGNGGGLPPDDRPYPVGYAEFPMTPLPARDGVAHGGVKRSAGAPNCSYFVNWKKLDDAMTWDIAVNTAGQYDATIHYTCPIADAGSTVELSFNGAKTAGRVAPGWDPPLLDQQDRVTRKGQSTIMKDFRTLSLGTMNLAPGRGLLTLRAIEIPGQSVMDVRLVTLTLRTDAADPPKTLERKGQ